MKSIKIQLSYSLFHPHAWQNHLLYPLLAQCAILSHCVYISALFSGKVSFRASILWEGLLRKLREHNDIFFFVFLSYFLCVCSIFFFFFVLSMWLVKMNRMEKWVFRIRRSCSRPTSRFRVMLNARSVLINLIWKTRGLKN